MMDLRYYFTGDTYIAWSGNKIFEMFNKNFNIKMCRDLSKLADIRQKLISLVFEDTMNGRR